VFELSNVNGSLEGGALIMEGRTFAKEGRARIKIESAEFEATHNIKPGLAVVLVGDDPASIDYTRVLVKNANDLGFYGCQIVLPANISRHQLAEEIHRLNEDRQIHGILPQWPLPPHLSLEDVADPLDPRKDVDGYHPLSLGRLMSNLDTFVPATPQGAMRLLEHYGFSVEGKTCLQIGWGVTVGRSLSSLLLTAGAALMIIQRPTPPEVIRRMAAEADFLFTAAGVPNLVSGDLLHPNIVAVDFGVNYIGDKMVGDLDFESVRRVVRAVTPTPGGTGPTTTVALFDNLLKAARLQLGNRKCR
jgi:methylenetetrahydrofolate dehydrogenase (NADP+)/methenyltetrahydrofolate cyclohydrolase